MLTICANLKILTNPRATPYASNSRITIDRLVHLSFYPRHRTVLQQPQELAKQSLLMIINHTVLISNFHYFLILAVGDDVVLDRFFNHIS